MSDFLESAKNLVNSTVSRTGWEAQKQMRIRSKQKEIDKLVEQRQQLMEEMGQTAMTLYQQGALSDTQLSRLCASILELDHDLRTREQQFQDIKIENYPADQFAPAATANYAPPTPSTPTNAAPPPSSQPSQPPQPSQPYQAPNTNTSTYGGYQPDAGAKGQGQPLCPQCGSPIRANSAYCRGCGAKLR
jgi:zinc-ribbon domain